ncbi:MAG: hypothetical protein WAP03_13215 [Methylorubrum rhodinum]|uniref:hypothetical protein n=1 Tax=Methylorubrum rhodinum TaxID=29428 RepID=UPI003BAE1688
MSSKPDIGGSPTFHRFDGAAAWAALDDAQRAVIGAHALEIVLVLHLQDLEGQETLSDPFARIASAADSLLVPTFEALVRDALSDDAFMAPNGQPRVPSLLGDICRVCACSYHDPCPEGCGWAAEDLCTVCAEREAAA